MREQGERRFQRAEFALLKKAEPLVSAVVRQFWTKIAGKPVSAKAAVASAASSRSRTKRLERGCRRSHRLTAREAAIIELVLQGHSSESVGLHLGISTGTVKVHRRNIYRKLGISSQTQLFSLFFP